MAKGTENNITPTIEYLVCKSCWGPGGLFAQDSFLAVLSAVDDPQSEGYTYTSTWDNIWISAESGCNWCRLLVGEKKRKPGKVTVQVACLPDPDFTPVGTKKLTLKVHDGDWLSRLTEFHMYTDADDSAASIISSQDRVLQVSSPSSFRLAAEKIKACTELHPLCPKSQLHPLPDRVIDCRDPSRPKILLTDNVPGLYAALSYIWGEPQPFSTTKNITTHINPGLDLQTTPQTIRDGIQSTHNLGLSYLWVDALCILQDSVEDKIRQIGQMRNIYHNAHITIIAASANKVSEGFLQDRPARIPTTHIPFRCPDGNVGTVKLVSSTDHGLTGRYYDELEPVNYRGWCMQERLLSPRCLIFASHTIQYYCQTETANIGDALCEPSTGRRLPSSVFLSKVPSEADDINSRRAWLYVIFDYTGRSITVPSDKLVALAGIAEQFYNVWSSINTKYLAGLWQHTFVLDLLWYRYADERRPRCEIARAPSWSWAAVEGRVIAQNFEERYKPGAYKLAECRVLACDVVLENEDTPFGAVRTGVLRLNVHLREAKLRISSPLKSAELVVQPEEEEPESMGLVNLDSTEGSEGLEHVWVLPVLWDQGGAFLEGLVLVADADTANHGCQGDFVGHRIGRYACGKGNKKEIEWIVNAPERNITIL